MGAPKNNQNALRHGLSTGALPPGATYIARLTNRFRAELEEAALEVRGEVGIYENAVINSAVRWERHSMLALRWLRTEAGSLTPDQRLAFSREVARASSERDKCLRLLGLHTKAQEGGIDLSKIYDVRPTGGDGESEGEGGEGEPDA